MTTTSTYQGLGEDTKPTSRVLRPPGGGSSNIFGAEPVQRTPNRPQSNDIFGTGPAEPVEEHKGKRRGGPADNSRDNVFGGSTTADSGSNTRAENKRRGQGAFNPITGEPIAGSPQKEPEEEERKRREPEQTKERGDEGSQPGQQALHTSSRVLAPPGGKSSGPLW